MNFQQLFSASSDNNHNSDSFTQTLLYCGYFSLSFQLILMGFSALGVFSTIKYISKKFRVVHNKYPSGSKEQTHARPTIENYSEKSNEIASDSDNDENYSIIGSNQKINNSEHGIISGNAGLFQEYKMVLLIRQDLEMSKGKIAAQCCHAVLSSYKFLQMYQSSVLARWEACGQPKVTLKVKDEKEMLTLMEKAREAGLCAKSIKDAGKTQIAPGSRTVAAIGPGPISIVDYITGHLKLY